MRIVCNVAVSNRTLSSLMKSHGKHVKSTLALCKHPKGEKEFVIVLFTAQNKTGVKYRVTGNVSGVMTRFVNEGKATIQLKEPPHDLFIKAETIELKGFLSVLRKVLENRMEKDLPVSSLSVTAVPKNAAPRRMVIKNRSELPMRGFPRTIETLSINEIGLCKLCIGVLQLNKLQVLDVSDNCLETLPDGLKNLPIKVLNVSKNQLGKYTKPWGWIGGTLVKNLKTVNLSHNELRSLPEQFCKFESLITILLNDNVLSSLPAGFGNFRSLRTLNVSRNNLTQVPGSMKRLHLEHLDISHNSFQPINVAAVFPKPLPVCSLKEVSARKVLYARLPYTPEDVPLILVEYLDNAHYCVCGRACFEVFLHNTNVLVLKTITQTCVGSVGDLDYLPMDCYYCSSRCFRRTSFINV